jgi:hypothetical protein
MPQPPELRQDIVRRGPDMPSFGIELHGVCPRADVGGIQHAVTGDAFGQGTHRMRFRTIWIAAS